MLLNSQKLWRRWHRRLAILTGLFICFQGITGAVAQQRFALLGFSEPEIYAVDRFANQALGPAQILEVIKANKPEFKPAHVMYPAANSPKTAVIVMGGRKPVGLDMSRIVTVDQYQGSVIAERDSSVGWVGRVISLHKWTNYGVPGRIVLSIFALLSIAFLITAIVNWRITRKSAMHYSGVKKYHRSTGILIAPLLLVAASTGLILNLTIWQEKENGRSVVSTNMLAAMRGGAPEQIDIDLTTAYMIASRVVGDQHLAAFSNAGEHAAQYWFAFTDARLRRTDVLIDPNTAEASIYASGVYEASRLRGWLYPVHTGYVLGRTGGLIMTVIGLSLSFWLLSGFMQWRARR